MAEAGAVWLQDLATRIAAADTGEFWLLAGLGVLATIGCFAAAFSSLHKARLIEDMPTSKVRSAAQGFVELQGYARLLPGPQIVSPLSGARCCWWKYRIQRQETTWRNGKRTTHWRTIESGTSDGLFLLADDTGDCVVDPEGATLYPSLKRQWRGSSPRPRRVPQKTPWLQFGDYRYEEQLLCVGDPLHAIGWFRTQAAYHEHDEAAEVTELLREWKRDEASLLQQFDRDGDGRIDLDEWQAARRSALEQVRAGHVERQLSAEVHVLCRPPDRRSYILSTLPQERLARRYRVGGWLLLALSLLLGTATVFALTARGLI